jgi:hypothetical protein
MGQGARLFDSSSVVSVDQIAQFANEIAHFWSGKAQVDGITDDFRAVA